MLETYKHEKNALIYTSKQKWWCHDVFTGTKTTQEITNSQRLTPQVFMYSNTFTLAVSMYVNMGGGWGVGGNQGLQLQEQLVYFLCYCEEQI